jgi:catechol 2,3-dioxygenase-like lactoylglutathione lyase family enzyme
MSNHTIVIPAPDLAATTAFYRTAWGTEPHTETPYYVGFNLDGREIGLNPRANGTG